MGHAHLKNLSEFFVRRLYAKGSMTIQECCTAMLNAGEKLHTSEGEYEDGDMLMMGLADIVHYLTRDDPSKHHYSGPVGGGPWIEPSFNPGLLRPRGWNKSLLSNDARIITNLLAVVRKAFAVAWHSQNGRMESLILADKIEDAGHLEWARHVRSIWQQSRVWFEYLGKKTNGWRWDGPDSSGVIFDGAIRWVFSPGKRTQYTCVPILCNVTR